MVHEVVISSCNYYQLFSKTIFIKIHLDAIKHFLVSRRNSFWDLEFKILDERALNINKLGIIFMRNKEKVILSLEDHFNLLFRQPCYLLLNKVLFWIIRVIRKLIGFLTSAENSNLEVIRNITF